jgi:hypothetical protein
MKGMKAPPRELGAGLMVYVSREQREQLHEVLKRDGIYSASSWLREIIVHKLREAGDKEDPRHAVA